MSESEFVILTLYGAIGFSGALSILIFLWGLIVYLSRMGTDRRQEGLDIMEWGVGLAITSVVLIGILHFAQNWLGIGI